MICDNSLLHERERLIFCLSTAGEIHTDVIKEILLELFSSLTQEEVDDIIADIDEDGSGWVDYDEFKELMLGN